MPTRREVLEHDVTLKLQLEARLKPRIVQLFNRIGRDYRASVARSGSPQQVGQYRDDLVSILEAHYREVATAFTGSIKWQTGERKQAEGEDEVNEELALLLFLDWVSRHAGEQADIILATTGDDQTQALQMARQELVEGGVPAPSFLELAAAAAAVLARALTGRTETIVTTETQTSAETFKGAEVSAAARVAVPGLVPPQQVMPGLEPLTVPLRVRKTWITLADSRVRESHRAVNGRSVLLNEPFIVGGARLMFPGDTSLGAPIREIINCRCSALYILEPF